MILPDAKLLSWPSLRNKMNSAKAGKLTIQFGPPEHGWMRVEVQAGEQSWLEDGVSDVPADSLLMLAEACLKLIEGTPQVQVTWFLEPAEVHWRWTKAHDRIEFAIVESSKEHLRMTGSVEDLCFPAWRALRALESNPCWALPTDPATLVWSHPFPHKETQQLGEKLKALRA